MDLRKQIVNLELAIKLKELGVKQESIWWWYCDEERDDTPVVNLNDETKYVKYNGGVGYYDHKYSAFTASELGELLPWSIHKKSEMPFCLEIRKMIADVDNDEWTVRYIRGKDAEEQIPVTDDTEANARAKMLIYLIENKFI